MLINTFIWSDLSPELKTKLLNRAQADISAIMEQIRPILSDVRFNGDAGVLAYTRKHDKVDLTPAQIKVSEEEFASARAALPDDLKAAIEFCAGNVRAFHAEQLRRVEKEWWYEVMPGVLAGEKVTPIDSVGLYAPGGKNSFPSSVYMLAIPAVLAGVSKIAIVTPPRRDGTADAAALYAAEISGATDVYKAGGAQAIAALAYGTESIPKVAKVLGPCSPYGAAAKMVLSHIIDPGMPAGPSESIILCDETADPHNTVLDLLNEMEHGPDSAALLVTHYKPLADAVRELLPDAVDALPEPQRSYCKTVLKTYGGIILTRSLTESLEVCNEIATEHLLIKTKDPVETAQFIRNAGELLFGENSPSTLGNYGIGINHVLPTGGMAKSYSATSIWDFLKRTSLAKTTAEGLENLKGPVVKLAEYEGFPAHKNAVLDRTSS
ncbi:MAG: histidinol dehydrogenase [Rhodospirillales bacterium]|nr:histidinol dehydrogenase [Rhodospirillales bacterium]